MMLGAMVSTVKRNISSRATATLPGSDWPAESCIVSVGTCVAVAVVGPLGAAACASAGRKTKRARSRRNGRLTRRAFARGEEFRAIAAVF